MVSVVRGVMYLIPPLKRCRYRLNVSHNNMILSSIPHRVTHRYLCIGDDSDVRLSLTQISMQLNWSKLSINDEKKLILDATELIKPMEQVNSFTSQHLHVVLGVLENMKTDCLERDGFIDLISCLMAPYPQLNERDAWVFVRSVKCLRSENESVRKLLSLMYSKINYTSSTSDMVSADTALCSISGLQGLSSDCAVVRELVSVLSLKLKEKTMHQISLAAFREALRGLRRMNSSYSEVRDLLCTLTEFKKRYNREDENNSSLSGIVSPWRYGFPYMNNNYDEVREFILALGPRAHLYSPDYDKYKYQNGSYIDIMIHLGLEPHSTEFLEKNGRLIQSIHEAGHVVASYFVENSPCQASNVSIGSLAYAYIPHDIEKIGSTEKCFLAHISSCMAGLAAEHVVFGSVTYDGSDADIKKSIVEISEQYTSDGIFIPRRQENISFGKLIEFVYSCFIEVFFVREAQWISDHIFSTICSQFLVSCEVLTRKKNCLIAMADSLNKNGKLSERQIKSIISTTE